VAVALETDELYLSSFAAIDGAFLISLGAGRTGAPIRGKDADFAISICFSVDKRTVSMDSSMERNCDLSDGYKPPDCISD
jgi:hypothetical protein